MKKENALMGFGIQNCVVVPWYEIYNKNPCNPYFGSITTSPNLNGNFIRDGVLLHDLVLRSNKPSSEGVWRKDSHTLQVFQLEVPGYGEENLSVEIKDLNSLIVSFLEDEKVVFSKKINIPTPEFLDFENPIIEVKDGILKISFSILETPKVNIIKIL